MRTSNAAAVAAPAVEREARASGCSKEAKIAELRRQFFEGAYRVDPAKVSAKMIDAHLSASDGRG
ncbi:MAG: flagellar biosynthesis anti-sigma factor FlgM [Acidobacteriaceae bacterium]|nr:flagellar biosynthesis anti-sigma factor FlgM [Acidobacteriaceae bacterium]